MKKKYSLIVGTILILFVVVVNNYVHFSRVEKNIRRSKNLISKSKVEEQKDLAEDLIRFHVLANSDTAKDQDVKLRVKGRVLREITPALREAKDIEETRAIIKNNQNKIVQIAKRVIEENGENYDVNTTLGSFAFPAKYYGRFSLPPGEYEAFRIVLGEGKGSNWWCVMFPPLCFINIEREEEPQEIQEEENPQTMQVRWKFLELFHSLFKNNNNQGDGSNG